MRFYTLWWLCLAGLLSALAVLWLVSRVSSLDFDLHSPVKESCLAFFVSLGQACTICFFSDMFVAVGRPPYLILAALLSLGAYQIGPPQALGLP